MYCEQCGSLIPDDSKFCPVCGGVTAQATVQGGGYYQSQATVGPAQPFYAVSGTGWPTASAMAAPARQASTGWQVGAIVCAVIAIVFTLFEFSVFYDNGVFSWSFEGVNTLFFQLSELGLGFWVADWTIYAIRIVGAALLVLCAAKPSATSGKMAALVPLLYLLVSFLPYLLYWLVTHQTWQWVFLEDYLPSMFLGAALTAAFLPTADKGPLPFIVAGVGVVVILVFMIYRVYPYGSGYPNYAHYNVTNCFCSTALFFGIACCQRLSQTYTGAWRPGSFS